MSAAGSLVPMLQLFASNALYASKRRTCDFYKLNKLTFQ